MMEYIKELVNRLRGQGHASPLRSSSSDELEMDLFNVAPLGSITSSNSSAQPPSFLLDGSGPGPRHWWWGTRTPSWSYYFSSGETFLELVITLPSPVLLGKVEVLCGDPKYACPSAVTIAVNRNQKSSAIITEEGSWHSRISIRLQELEFVEEVKLCLHKSNLADFVRLSQIRLLEMTWFSEIEAESNPDQDQNHQDQEEAISIPIEDNQNSWMSLFDKAKDLDLNLLQEIVESSVHVPDILQFCSESLLEPQRMDLDSSSSLSRIMEVLFHLELHRKGPEYEPLIDTLFGPVQEELSQKMSESISVQAQLDAVVELLYKLCTSNAMPEKRKSENLNTVIRWLDTCTDDALSDYIIFRANGAEHEYLRAVSAALWTLAAEGKEVIVSPYLLKKLLKWSLKLGSSDSDVSTAADELKSIVDHVICSICFCQPWLFLYLMYSMDLVKVKGEIDLSGMAFTDLLQQWYKEGRAWTKVEMKDARSIVRDLDLDINALMTLARAAQSPPSASILKASSLLEIFNSIIMDFCNNYNSSTKAIAVLTVKPAVIVDILKFYGELCKANDFKNWFQATNDSAFWLPLLNLLSSSTLPSDIKSSEFGLADMESAVIDFLLKSDNYNGIASCLKEIISREQIISSFCHRLVVQIIEEEFLLVHIHVEEEDFNEDLKIPCSNLLHGYWHPSRGVSSRDRLFTMRAYSSVNEMLQMLLDASDSDSEFDLRLEASPEVQVPLNLSMRTIRAALKMPFLDVLDFSLKKKRKESSSASSEPLQVPPVPSMLEDVGLLTLLFQRFKSDEKAKAKGGISVKAIDSFRIFLHLPQYIEVLLGETFHLRANAMIRLLLGVTVDLNGNDLASSTVIKGFATLPWEVLSHLLETTPPSTKQGCDLRQAMFDQKILHFILSRMATLTHYQHQRQPSPTPSVQENGKQPNANSKDKKGTGYSTGYSYLSSWNVQQDLLSKQMEEKSVIFLFNLLSNYINPQRQQHQFQNARNGDTLFPSHEVCLLLQDSCLVPIISDYLRNDSVLDITRHVPLYKAVMKFLRSLASTPKLLFQFTPKSDEPAIHALLAELNDAVDSYSKRLQASKLEDKDLVELIRDIGATTSQVQIAVKEMESLKEEGQSSNDEVVPLGNLPTTLEERYVNEMRKLQFSFYEMITEGPTFRVPYHFESNVRSSWNNTTLGNRSRAKRLAQESMTLQKSLPLSYGSSIFVRCDNDRLDVVKVLITGPAGTPYSNGCFEFDVFFPLDYPNSPLLVNFQTTGRGWVRFNPNLYESGKVCLSILNTWFGSPEERWNPQVSNLYLVLVAIQSLILVEEPYYNEPGWGILRGTEQGEQASKQYNNSIRNFTLQHAMLGQIRSPSPCFKEIIHRHFWIKKEEILNQCVSWAEDSSSLLFKTHVSSLKAEIMKMPPPEGLEDLQFDANAIPNCGPDSCVIS